MVKQVSSLPLMASDMKSNASLLLSSQSSTVRWSVSDFVNDIRKELGYYPQVLKKCDHCGQWGAVMCACPACGAPIDPER